MFAKKITKVYKDGKLVNTITTSMSKSKLNADLANTYVQEKSGMKTKLKLGFSGFSDSEHLVHGYRTSFTRTLGDKPVKYVYDTEYKYYSNNKRKKRK